jgi:hypothetical protein
MAKRPILIVKLGIEALKRIIGFEQDFILVLMQQDLQKFLRLAGFYRAQLPPFFPQHNFNITLTLLLTLLCVKFSVFYIFGPAE